MSTHSEAGKGDKRRPGDDAAYANSFQKIFGEKKVQRGKFVFCPTQNKFVSFDEYIGPVENRSAFVMGDIQPYKSMQTGEMITSRSKHREHLKQHGLIEVGNEVDYMIKRSKERTHDFSGLRETLTRVTNAKLK